MELVTTIVPTWFDKQTINVRTILLATIVFLSVYLITISRKKLWNKPPGPIAWWPIIGHLATLDRVNPFRTVAELTKTYGSIISLKFGSFPVVVLNDYASVHQAFVKQGHQFDDRPDFVLARLSKGKGKVLQSIHHKMAVQLSKNAVSAFQISCNLLSFILEDS